MEGIDRIGKSVAAFVVLVMMLSLSIPSVSGAQIPVDNEQSIEAIISKLAPNVIEIVKEADTDEQVDVTVICNREADIGYIQEIRNAIPSMDVVEELHAFKIFRAHVPESSIIQLAEISFVNWIEANRYEQVQCMESARGPDGTNVDALRSLYPELDGDRDGSITGYSKDDVVIAILDTGIDSGHYDLDGGKVIGWHDVIFQYPLQYDDSPNGHGTHCASIAAGSGDAEWNKRGVAPYAALVVVKVLYGNGATLWPWYPIAGFNWVALHKDECGIDIVSCSWGRRGGDYEGVAQVADALVSNYNLIVCAGAGNYVLFEEPTLGAVATPATGRYVVAVGNSVDRWGLNPLSCWGPTDDGRIKPDILAPGTSIWSAKSGTYNEYREFGGTSAACPFAAGLFGLFLEFHELDGNEADFNPRLKHLFMASAVELQDDVTPGKDNKNGAGMVDAMLTFEFWNNDVSSSYADAKSTIVNPSWEDQSWERTNEPMWVYDGEDWYWLMCYTGKFIWVQVLGDPDFIGTVYILDQNRNVLWHSYPMRNPSVGVAAGYSGLYYVKVTVESFSGDYYDISIHTTLS